MSKTAYIGIGSNLGNRTENCLQALHMAGSIPGCTLEARSDLYRTEPVGTQGQQWFVNAVMALRSEISARELLGHLMAIESAMGRVRKGRWDPRRMDLDILLFGDDVIRDEDLKIPHPLMHQRRFVLVPMVQLAPNLVHPVLGMTMTELLHRLPADGQEVIGPKEA
jgi:2-amino-4-hydroxy-6-hydroxymethyldihydropteridine diphosphokinase